MDNSSNCELLDSLDFLRPPVKRRSRKKGTALNLDNHLKSNKVLNDFRTNVSKETQHPQPGRRRLSSSSSLILKRTTEREIVKSYTVLSYTSLYSSEQNDISRLTKKVIGCREKPLIQVTVIPNSAQTQTSDVFRKRKRVVKRAQVSVSNHENSIQAKNLYLVLAAQNTDKIYEIKRTGSVKISNTDAYKLKKNEEVPLEQLSSLKLVLDSLNMDKQQDKDKRRKKKQKKPVVYSDESVDMSGYRNVQSNVNPRECRCSSPIKGDNTDLESGKSCVRITGRLGRTEDDRYVLRCAATIDDQPVYTEFNEVDIGMKPYMNKNDCRFTNCRNMPNTLTECSAKQYRNQRDCNIQTDFLNDSWRAVEAETTPRYPMLVTCNTCLATCSKYSSGQFCNKRDSDVQADLLGNIRWNLDQVAGSSRRMACCKPCQASHSTQANLDIGFMNFAKPKRTFPANDGNVQCCCTASTDSTSCGGTPSDGSDNEGKALKESKSPLVVISVYPMQDGSENVKVVTNPPLNFTTPKNIRNDANKEVGTTKRNPRQNLNVNRSPISRSTSPSPLNKNKINVTEKKFVRSNSRKRSPVIETNKMVTNKPNRRVSANQEKSNVNRVVNRSGAKDNKSLKKVHTGTNTEHSDTKKRIVDDYTKKLNAYLQYDSIDSGSPKNNSKLTINIDKGCEYYNVMLKQGRKCTDSNRKTQKAAKGGKGTRNTKYVDMCDISPSLHNLLYVPENADRRSLSAAFAKHELQNEVTLKDTISRIQLRDSLEITHRREDSGHVLNNTTENNREKTPGRHYRGDNCLILDPMKRDQEIRALLGIKKGRNAATATNNTTAYPLRQMIQRPQCYDNDESCFNKGARFKLLQISDKPSLSPWSSRNCEQILSAYSRMPAYASPPPCPSAMPVKRKCHLCLSEQDMLCDCQIFCSNIPPQEPTGQTAFKTQLVSYKCNIASETAPENQNVGCKCGVAACGWTGEIALMNKVINFQSECDIACDSNTYKKESHSKHSSRGKPCIQRERRKRKQSSILQERSMLIEPSKHTSEEGTSIKYEEPRQTSLYQQLILNRNIQVFLQLDQFCKQKPIILSRKQYDKVKRAIKRTISNKSSKRSKCICKASLVSVSNVKRQTKNLRSTHYNMVTQTLLSGDDLLWKNRSNCYRRSRNPSTYVLFANKRHMYNKEYGVTPRRAASSVEIRYASLSFTNHVKFSSTNVEAGSVATPLEETQSLTLHTIFQAGKDSGFIKPDSRRRCPTPNLGTSVCSLNSEDQNYDDQYIKPEHVPENKHKKPFLRRLMSCLVMRSARATDMNPAVLPPSNKPSVGSSIDSYHINTSFCGVEMTSSMYDTSISFYSNHSVYPVNSKIKRGFFNSVREFLSIRKSQTGRPPI